MTYNKQLSNKLHAVQSPLEPNERNPSARHEASWNPKIHYLAICPDPE
jgi:hypothetical protein